MTSKERAYLRGLANTIDAIFQVGKGGISDVLLEQLNNAIGNIATGISANIGSGLNISGTNSSSMRPIFNVYVDSHTDPLGQTVSSIKTFSGGAKNDYNYGVGV